MKHGYHYEVVFFPGHGGDGLVGQLGRFALGNARVANTVEVLPTCVFLRRWWARVQTPMKAALKRLDLIAYCVLSGSYFQLDLSAVLPFSLSATCVQGLRRNYIQYNFWGNG